jgi:hypothetical protein
LLPENVIEIFDAGRTSGGGHPAAIRFVGKDIPNLTSPRRE